MNFMDDIRCFCHNKLRPVSTLVQTPDGRSLVESRDEVTGQRVTRLTGRDGPGFVRDLRPDLQVATVAPGLSLGSQDVACEFGLLRHHRVTHILNLGTGIANSFEGSFTYKRVEIYDLPDVSIRDLFDDCFLFIDSAIGNSATSVTSTEAAAATASESGATVGIHRKHVFVHCNAGISRAATIVVGYLMSRRRMRYAEALTLVRTVRPAVRPNDGFDRQLRDFDRELHADE